MNQIRKTWLVIVLMWSLSVCHAQQLSEVRFRIDDNPVPVSQYVLSGDVVDGNFAVDLTGIAAGTHWLYVEVGAAGQWSLYAKKLIAVEGDIDMALLTQAEYYFDTDPGEGNGYAVLLPSDSAVDEQLIITIPPDLSRGVHTLCTRVSDAGGQWSQVVRRKIIVEGATGMVSITGAEYFFDSDPGVGEGYALAIPASSSIDQDFDIPIPGDLSLGTHTMYIRMHDGGAQYAHYVHFPVEICESYPPVAAFDVQPYQGNLYYTFTNQSSLAQESQWYIDGSPVGTDSVFVQLFDAIGNYEVCLEAQNACGIDEQCDTISVLGITDVFGTTGSNSGYCTVHIRGAFVEGAVASLTSDDFPAIVADTTIFVGSDELLAVFNLIGASPGLRDVQVSQDLETYVLPGAFEITTAVIEPIDLTILGRARALAGSTQTFRVDAQNPGNTDAFAVPLLFRNIPQGAVYDITGAVNEMDITQEDYFDELIQFANDNDMDMLYLSRHMFDESTGTAGVGYLVPMIPASSNILPEVYLQFNSYNLNARTTYAPWIGSGSFDEPLNLQPGCLSAYAGDCLEEVTGTSLPDNYETCFDAAFTDAMDFVGQHISTHWTSGGYIPLQAIMGSIFLKVTDCLSITPDGDMLRDFILAFNAKTQFLPVEMEDCETGFHADMPLIPSDPHLPDPDEYRGECPPNFNFSAFMGGLNASNQDAFRNLCAIFASDPNTKEGPGTNNDTWLNAIRPLSYQLWFENVDTATAPASEVRLIDTLDLTVYDPQTFRATGFGVNDRMWSIPQDRMSHHEIVDLRPEVPVLVKVDVDFNETDGVIHVVYTALDTLTLQAEEDPDLGFLPPNINSPEGIGWFSFDVALRTDLDQGEAISNHAAIYFDYNAPVITEDWTNWFDDEPPFSSFTMGNISNTESVEVTWSAGDEDAGLNHIEIYITEIVDGAPLTYLWQTLGADVFSTTYEGSFGDQVTFSIIAYDNAGNVQSEPSVAEVSIVTSLSDLDSGTFEVVPNPAMDVVRITTPIGTETLRVLDLTGRVMFETGINASQFNLDLGFLSGGLYMVECTAGRYSQRIPLVMQ